MTTHSANPITLRSIKKSYKCMEEFIQKTYMDCARKNGDKVDFSTIKNGSEKLIMYQYFNANDSTYMQFFQNLSPNI